MYKTILVNKSIEDGERLIGKLEEKNFLIAAAFWNFLDDEKLWRLVIASPLVDRQGPVQTYMDITKALDELGMSVQLTISDISAISPSWSKFRDFRRMIEGTLFGRSGSGTAPGRNQWVGVDTLYLYRWNPDLKE